MLWVLVVTVVVTKQWFLVICFYEIGHSSWFCLKIGYSAHYLFREPVALGTHFSFVSLSVLFGLE